MNGLWRLLFTIIIVFFFFFATPCSSADPDGLYEQCATPFSCLKFTNLGFPFWGSARPANCGIPAFQLTCHYYSDYVTIDLSNLTHKILELDSVNKTMRVQRQDLMDGCFITPRSSIIDFTLFNYSPGYQNVTFFYGCSSPPRRSTMFHLPAANDCYINGSSYYVVYVGVGSRGSESCNSSIVLPIASVDVEKIGSLESLMAIAAEGFEIKWKVDSAACNLCVRSNGQCGYNASMSDSAVCYCIQPPYLGRTCPSLTANAPPASSPSGTRSRKLLMTAGITVAVICGSVFLALAYFIIRRRNPIWQTKESMNVSSSDASSSRRQVHLFNKNPSYPFTKFEIEKGSTYFGVQVFNYAELEDATDYFDPSHQLGDGGFGVVYYGELHDGRPVAVKRLYERNFKSMEQFMNEVEILARLRHPNLVTLYGCTSRRSRDLLLVYEYVPNGTLAEHLHGRQSSSGFLNWPVRLNIALETASALAYLHASDIIHRDVKTTNILLDGKLSVKVVDFGLSRLFPVDVTHISTAPQGTAGYVDPEYYTCYQLTDKSDVYSFGVVMAELISSKEAVDVTRRRHEINLANMALTMMQERSLDDLVDPRLGFESDDAVRNEVIRASDLAFRCLQKDPAARPSMDEVLDVLREIANAVSGDIAGRDDRNDDSPFLRPTVKGGVYPTSPDSVVNTQWTSGSVTSN